MTVTQKYAFATGDPAALDAYRAVAAARHEFSHRLFADAAALGHNRGPMSRKRAVGGEEIVGLRPDQSGQAPDGWHLVERGKRLAPRTGPAGGKARAWLAAHQPPAGTDRMLVMAGHGLIPYSKVETGGKYTCYRPVLFEWDGKLWACYRVTPGAGAPGGITWPSVPLEDCLAALDRRETRRRLQQLNGAHQK
jgi:hypothetical protein